MSEINNYIEINNNKSKIKEINNGIQILRMILSYLILQLHCYNIKLTKNKILIFLFKADGFYVPTFYIIAYFFSFKDLQLKNIFKIRLRLKRIIIPYIIWPLLFFIRNNINYYFYKENNNHKIKGLVIQLLCGVGIHSVFWFQCNLILSYILFSIFIFILESNYLFIMQLIGIGGYCFFCIQYYYNLFNKCKHEVRILIRDFSYVLFYGAIGISLSSLVKIIYLKKHRKKSIFFTLIILYLLKDFDIIIKKCFYLRCAIFGIGSVSLFILFSMLLFDGKNNEKNDFIIKNMTNYTGGIYYLHTKINKILSGKLLLMKNKTFIGCILNYLLCYSICFLGIKTLGKTQLKYLFI